MKKAKKELMFSSPIFNKKDTVRDFDPGLMEKVFQPNKIESMTDNDEIEKIEIVEPKPKRERSTKRSGPKVTEASDE